MNLYIEENDLQSKIENGAVLVCFSASWCGPCQAMAPMIDELAENASGYSVFKANVDEYTNLGDLGIRSVPTFITYKDGNEVGRIVGSTTNSLLFDLVEKAK